MRRSIETVEEDIKNVKNEILQLRRKTRGHWFNLF